MLKHQDSWPSLGQAENRSPRAAVVKTSSQMSLGAAGKSSRVPLASNETLFSAADAKSTKSTVDSVNIPMVEMAYARSLDNIDNDDILDNITGIRRSSSSSASFNDEKSLKRSASASLYNMMPLDEFKKLDGDGKNAEILKLLPLLKSFAKKFEKDLSGLSKGIGTAADKLAELEQAQSVKGGDHYWRRRPPYLPILPGLGQEQDEDSMISERLESQPPTPSIIHQYRAKHRRVALNVGGVRHEVMWKMLEQIPKSRLGLLSRASSHLTILQLCSDYSLQDNEYFFDRHPRSFNTILNFYRTGKLHISDEMCVWAFKDDLDYWAISEAFLEPCCQNKFEKKRDFVMEEMEVEADKLKKDDEDDFGTGRFAKYQKFLWDLIEKPDTSFAAQMISYISMLFVVVSTVGMTLNTMPDLQGRDYRNQPIDNPYLAMVETVCISWFTLEYLLRFAACPKKWEFLKNGLNIVDVMAIMPYYVSLFLLDGDPPEEPSTMNLEGTTSEPPSEEGSIEDVLQVFRIFKLARIFKLGRHSPGLQSIAYTLINSKSELGLLVFFVSITGLIFASLCYFIELGEDSGFTDILTGFYWVVITMTTVGYGDISPYSPLGKLVGSLCAVSGVLVLSLPIPVIAENFEKFHKMQHKKNKAIKRKEALLAAKAEEEEIRVSAMTGRSRLTTPNTRGRSRSKSPVASLLRIGSSKSQKSTK